MRTLEQALLRIGQLLAERAIPAHIKGYIKRAQCGALDPQPGALDRKRSMNYTFKGFP